LPRQEVEGHIYYAQFCGFARTLAPESVNTTPPRDPIPVLLKAISASPPQSSKHDFLKALGLSHIASATVVIDAHPSLSDMVLQVESVEHMLCEGVFYQAVSAEELRAVYTAMANSFRGTGHWYTCQNGHPFTVGECGMPMERVRCPECEAPIGGRDHRPADGVRRAVEMDELAAEVGGMGL
jgi:ribosomal protein L30/L7E